MMAVSGKSGKARDGKSNSGEGPFINLSVKLFLTDLGTESAGDSDKVQAMTDMGGNAGSGIESRRIFAATLKDFIINSRINQIELERAELVSRRHELIDLTKLIVYAILYRLFPHNMFQWLEARGLVEQKLSPTVTRSLLEKHGPAIRQFRLRLLEQARGFQNDRSLGLSRDEETRRKEVRSVTNRFLEMIPTEFYDSLLRHEEMQDELLAEGIGLLRLYLERTLISDYLSSAFLEWVENAERINMGRAFELLSARHRMETGEDFPYASLDEYLEQDPTRREELAGIAEQNRISLRIQWKFGKSRHGKNQNIEDTAVVKIRLRCQGLIGEWVRKHVEPRLNSPAHGHSLGELYQDEESRSLGLWFTAFLREECRKRAIEVFVQTYEDQKKRQTVLTLTLQFNPLPR
jgi:hypothetical protein